MLCENGGVCHLKGNDHGGCELENEYACECPVPFTGSTCRDDSSAQEGALSTNPTNGTAQDHDTLFRAVVIGIASFVLLSALAILIRIKIVRKAKIPNSERREKSLEEDDGTTSVEEGCGCCPKGQQVDTEQQVVQETTVDGATLPPVT